MLALIRTTFGGGGGTKRLLALGSLLALLAALLLTLAPAAADGHPDDLELILSIADDSDNVVPAGSEFTVNAALRFSTYPPAYTYEWLNIVAAGEAASQLRISGVLDWESSGSRRLAPPAQTPLFGRLPAVAGADRPMVKAFDGRTLVARDRAAKLHIFDSYTLQHKATINPPTGADTGLHNGFGASVAYNNNIGGFEGSAIALWHETDTRAWLFVGSYHDTVEATDQLGRLYIFRLDWDAAAGGGVTVTPQGSLAPTLAEANNRHGAISAKYGAAVAVSRDGGTLAVSAPTMNEMGAIYVYSRPDGAGQDWGDITYADGVKVTAAAVPTFGPAPALMPFDPANAGTCDAWCSRVWSNIASQGGYDGVDLAAAFVSLSADGRVLAAGAPEKDFASTTLGGDFIAANQRDNAGDAFVWVAPDGGWSNAPRADRDADGNAKTLMPAETLDATSFRQATHYSPGPLRRWTEPAAILTPEEWPDRGTGYFGLTITVSPDGAVIVVDDIRAPGSIYLFQRNSADDWAALNGGYLTASAAFANLGAHTFGTRVFSYDGAALAVGDPAHSGNQGSVLIFSRPADGTWVNAGLADAVRQLETATVRSAGAYGYVVPELQGRRVVIASRVGLNYLSSGGCAVRTVDGVTTTTCPISLPNAGIAIPDGTPDGPFSINGTVALRLREGGDPVATLRGTLELTVGTVDELTEVEFGFATDTRGDSDSSNDRPYPGAIAAGESTTLLLKLLNENGKASAKGAVSTVLFSASQGKLNAALGGAAAEACLTGGGQTCQIADAATALTASNSDQIRLTVEHPGAGRSGVATVRVRVLSSDGESFAPEPLRVILAGPPASIAVSGSTGGGLLSANAESAEGAESSGTDTDTRDQLTLSVTAADAAGNKAPLPRGARIASLSGPDGKRVSSGVAIAWPLGGSDNPTLDLAGNEQLRIDVNRPASSPLANGEYTLEVRAGALRASHTFSVSGAPATVTLSAPEGTLELREQFTLRATIVDANGAAVPDGTTVEWSATPVGAGSTLVETASERKTKGGKASATWLVVGPGATTVRAAADAAAAVTLVEVAGPPAPPVRLLDLLAVPYTQGSNIWFGEFSLRASSLLRELPNADVVHIWQGARWYRYSEVEGEQGEESIDFTIHPNAVLWFGDDD